MSEWWVYTSIATSVAAVVAVVGLIYKIGKWVGVMESTKKAFDAFARKVDEDIKELRGDVKTIMQQLPPVGKIDEDIKELRGDVKTIMRQLPSTSAITSGSPLHLTDMGKDISQTLHAREWAENTAPDLGERVRGKQPYDVQEICFEYVRKEFRPTEELDAKIGMCAYENGIGKDKVLEVLAIELRDALLEDA